MTNFKYATFLRKIVWLCVSCIAVSACQSEHQASSLKFKPIFGEVSLNCNQILTINEQSWSLGQLQFFIADIQALDEQGRWQTIDMANTPNQTQNVALLGSECGETITNDQWQITLRQAITPQHYKRVRFTLGVPFSLNHLNPLELASPLNMPSMFWVWRSGHKFMRLELNSQDDAWLFHLGSTGCHAVSPVRAPTSPCLNPNQVVIDLPVKQNLVVTLDIKVLLTGMNLTEENSCQSEPDNPHCQLLFERIGISGVQSLFGVSNER